ncbi:hypothetical protein U6A24_01675 [Aquimarina gracilis]|uniref:Secreted protein (Por secretion system target) n=1 Tax=Aquimarina gracilis TaxID=874422 RepID=A0ABU5ZRD7_9FLAO|nr:hypothetical protein [Aquimarina gracilis]MEB3344147.1 hypothetical protein [Aquimarina gracilis]
MGLTSYGQPVTNLKESNFKVDPLIVGPGVYVFVVAVNDNGKKDQTLTSVLID